MQISLVIEIILLMNCTLSAASIAASAISAVANSLNYKERPARLAQRVGSLTKRQSLIAFSHLPRSQNSNNRLGYGEILRLTTAPSFRLTRIFDSVNDNIRELRVISVDSFMYLNILKN